jgi:hypothetical protein
MVSLYHTTQVTQNALAKLQNSVQFLVTTESQGNHLDQGVVEHEIPPVALFNLGPVPMQWKKKSAIKLEGIYFS